MLDAPLRMLHSPSAGSVHQPNAVDGLKHRWRPAYHHPNGPRASGSSETLEADGGHMEWKPRGPNSFKPSGLLNRRFFWEHQP